MTATAAPAMSWSRDWTSATREAVADAMVGFYTTLATSNKRWTATIDRDLVIRAVLDGELFQCVLVSGYLLAFQMVTHWYMAEGSFVFYEHLLLKVDPAANSIRPVLRAMEDIAQRAGCVGIAVGTALNASDEKLVRVYERRGFRVEAHAMFKELI
jgi:hypothetical protein